MKYYHHLLLVILLLQEQQVVCSEKQQEQKLTKTLHVYAIPGQNGEPGKRKLWRDKLEMSFFQGKNYFETLFQGKPVDVVHVATPRRFPDFGQQRCMGLLRKSLQGEREPYIIHASSQGTGNSDSTQLHSTTS